MPEDKGHRQFESDPWSQFMFGGPQGDPYGQTQSSSQNYENQQNNAATQTSTGSHSQINETFQSLLGPFMTSDGNLDMNKVMSGVDQAMKMMNQFGPAMKKLGPILEMFSKNK